MKSKTFGKRNEPHYGRQDLRKIIHISLGMIGITYAFLEWDVILYIWIIATVSAWILPIYLEQVEILLTHDERKAGYSIAMICYGILMIIGTILFRDSLINALILLSVIAFGDGFSGLIGATYRGTALPWNLNKTWSGTMSFIIFGTIGALVLILFYAVFTIHIQFVLNLGALPIFRVLMIMIIGALVESIPWRQPDNIPVGIVTIIALYATMGLNH
jgi:dolichol kinase